MSTPLDRTLALIRAAEAEARAAIEAEMERDPLAAFRLATEIAEEFRRAANHIAQLRGVAAHAIRERDKLSLRGLADRIDVSYPRARELAAIGAASEADSE